MGEPISTVGDLAGICGHDGTNWEKILIDASKRLVVAVASAVSQDAQMHGYYDGAWQKQPIVRGFSDSAFYLENYVVPANGTYILESTSVPAGEVHTYVAIGMRQIANPITVAQWRLESGATNYIFYQYLNIPANYMFTAPNPIVVAPGDNINCRYYGCIAGDTITLSIVGYKTDLDL